jgi:drug/metabolite transporter (DMT)-like permease
MRASPLLILLSMSAIWGLTWIAVKTGVEAVPPIFLAATRFVVAGTVLLVIFRKEIDLPAWPGRWLKMAIVALFLGTFCYGGLFWGMQFTPSGIAAIINLSLIPVGLLVIGALFRAEALGLMKIVGVLVGVAGLILMFAPEAASGGAASAAGITAITLATLSACLGSVLSRRWLGDLPTGAVSGALIFTGGVGLSIWSALAEPVSVRTFADLLGPKVFVSWLFLVVFGSLVAFTLYIHLLNVWGPLRAGLYAFISPIVALIAGYLVFGERLEPVQLAASALLILAAAIVMAPASLVSRFIHPKVAAGDAAEPCRSAS